jgi:hypothetical protein
MMRSVLVLALLLTGCAQPVDPGDDELPPSNLAVEFQSLAVHTTQFAVEAGAGSVTVQDRTITGTCHEHENRGAYREGSTVTLWIAHTGWKAGRNVACPDIGVGGAYRATIHGLEPGGYLLRVQYIGQIHTATYPRPALEQQITIR